VNPLDVLRGFIQDVDDQEWDGSQGPARFVRAALADVEAFVEDMRRIERMAGAAGAGEIPAKPLAEIARAALARFADSPNERERRQ
jgi:hypothetical protein